MMPTVSPELICRVMSCSVFSPLPCLYEKLTWSKSMLPLGMTASALAGWARSGVSVSTSAMRSALAVLIEIITNTIESIIRLISTLIT